MLTYPVEIDFIICTITKQTFTALLVCSTVRGYGSLESQGRALFHSRHTCISLCSLLGNTITVWHSFRLILFLKFGP